MSITPMGIYGTCEALYHYMSDTSLSVISASTMLTGRLFQSEFIIGKSECMNDLHFCPNMNKI